jgi:dihydroorotate dehydrogenase (NAD+) catalytic subunit
MIDLNGIPLRNRLVTAASLLGYGAPPKGSKVPYGMSPMGRFAALQSFGAVTTRTLTLEPREGHFTTKTDWRLREWPQLVRRYRRALRRIDSGWMNAFGWCNIGLRAYLDDYYPRTQHQNRIISVGGFSGEEFGALVEILNERVAPGSIAAVELNVSCHNVNFLFEEILVSVLEQVAPSIHPLILKLSPDSDYVRTARLAEEAGVAALTAGNTIRGLRLDPRTGRPWLDNRFGGMSGRCIKPIALRTVADLRDAGIRLPIIAAGGARDLDDVREFLWAGADAVSLGSECFLASPPGYLVAPLKARRLTRLARTVERLEPELARLAARPAATDEADAVGDAVIRSATAARTGAAEPRSLHGS